MNLNTPKFKKKKKKKETRRIKVLSEILGIPVQERLIRNKEYFS